jgi:hypothetical protein
MSRFFNRIGTQSIKYEFEFEIESVKLALDQSYNILVIIKRGLNNYIIPEGSHNVTTMRKAMLNTSKGSAIFEETLLLPATIYYESKTNKF